MTTTFTDRHGRSWDCTLTLAAASRIEGKAGVQILDPDTHRQTFLSLLTDVWMLCDCVWAVVRPQCSRYEGYPTDPDAAANEFAEAMDGDAIERARKAFWAALADFFPSGRSALSQAWNLHADAVARFNDGILSAEGDIKAVLDQHIEDAFTDFRNGLRSGT